MRTFIFPARARGAGKSTVAAILQRRLGTPPFEFGWIPELVPLRLESAPLLGAVRDEYADHAGCAGAEQG